MESYTLSALAHRKLIGMLGVLLPIVTGILTWIIDPSHLGSISITHYADTYILFEGVVMTTALFLFTYQGYDLGDKALCRVAAAGALILVIFPCQGLPGDPTRSLFPLEQSTSDIIHSTSASVFFICMLIMTWFQFTKGKGSFKSRIKKILVFGLCGLVQCGGIAIVVVHAVTGLMSTFLGEMVFLISFGTAWLIKGKMIEISWE